MNLAEKINFLMKQKNIKNPKNLSQKLNEKNLTIPYTTLLTIINNEVQDIKLGTARKLCNFFNITLDELLDDDISLKDFRYATNDGINMEGLTEEQINKINEYVDFIRNQKK